MTRISSIPWPDDGPWPGARMEKVRKGYEFEVLNKRDEVNTALFCFFLLILLPCLLVQHKQPDRLHDKNACEWVEFILR